LHSGYFSHAMNLPNRPDLISIGEPHLSHFSLVTSGTFTVILPLASVSNDFAFLHSGYPEQARNSPWRPHRTIIGFPHFSHMRSVIVSISALTFRMSTFASSRSAA